MQSVVLTLIILVRQEQMLILKILNLTLYLNRKKPEEVSRLLKSSPELSEELDKDYEKHASMLLEDYTKCNETECKKTLGELFSNEVSLIKNIFSHSRMSLYSSKQVSDEQKKTNCQKYLQQLFFKYLQFTNKREKEKKEEFLK